MQWIAPTEKDRDSVALKKLPDRHRPFPRQLRPDYMSQSPGKTIQIFLPDGNPRRAQNLLLNVLALGRIVRASTPPGLRFEKGNQDGGPTPTFSKTHTAPRHILPIHPATSRPVAPGP